MTKDYTNSVGKLSKLSVRQKEILQLLSTGEWEIGTSWGDVWMQKGGLGYGGESKIVNWNTFQALRIRGFIAQVTQRVFEQPQRYYITDKGKERVR